MKTKILLASVIYSSLCYAQSPVNAAMFGTMEARNLGPGTMSGRITAIEGVNKIGRAHV